MRKQKDRGIQVTQKTKDSRFAVKDTILTLKWRLGTLCFLGVTVSPRHFGITIITYFTFCWAELCDGGESHPASEPCLHVAKGTMVLSPLRGAIYT